MEAVTLVLLSVLFPSVCWEAYKLGKLEARLEEMSQQVSNYINKGGDNESHNSSNNTCNH